MFEARVATILQHTGGPTAKVQSSGTPCQVVVGKGAVTGDPNDLVHPILGPWASALPFMFGASGLRDYNGCLGLGCSGVCSFRGLLFVSLKRSSKRGQYRVYRGFQCWVA